MFELYGFELLQLLVAVAVFQAGYRIRKATDSVGWDLMMWTGFLIGVSSFTHLLFLLNTGALTVVEGLFMPSLGILLAGAGSRLVDEYGYDRMISDNVIYSYCVLVVLVSVYFMFQVSSQYVMGVAYLSAPFLFLPSVYTFYLMQKRGEKEVWRSMIGSTVFFLLSSVFTVYLAGVCRLGCRLYVYNFLVPFNFPETGFLMALAYSAPVIKMTAILLLSYSVYLFYHGVFRDVDMPARDQENVSLLISGVISNIGNVIGRPVARNAAEEAFKNNFEDVEEKQDSEEKVVEKGFEEVEEVLASRFEDILGPVGRKKVEDVASEIKKSGENNDMDQG